MKKITINDEKCTKCFTCATNCPLVKVMAYEKDEQYSDKAQSDCLECGNCAALCPHGAIQMGSGNTIPIRNLPSSNEVLDLITSRRSCRTFKDKKIDAADWDRIFLAARYAPTGGNVQKVELMVIDNKKILRQISEAGIKMSKNIYKCLYKSLFKFFFRIIFKKRMGHDAYNLFFKVTANYLKQEKAFINGDDPILFNAPSLLLFLSPEDDLVREWHATEAAQNVTLISKSLGIGTCYSCISVALGKQIKKMVPYFPKNYGIYNALIMGYEKIASKAIPPRKEKKVLWVE